MSGLDTDSDDAARPGSILTHAELAGRQEEIRGRQKRALERVNRLSKLQSEMSERLGEELSALKAQSEHLEQEEGGRGGVIATLTRRFASRRQSSGRRSIAEGLLRQYEVTTRQLQQAAAFADELKLCAAELQVEVDRLHEEHGEASAAQRARAERIIELEAALQEAEIEGLKPGGEGARRRQDALSFELRQEALNLQLLRARADLSDDNIGPTRALRDTVMALHEGLTTYLITATGAVDAAGQRVQALGLAADTPAVIAELQESIEDLSAAMLVTSTYVRDTQEMLGRVLPDLTRQVRKGLVGGTAPLSERSLTLTLDAARGLADRALIESAAQLDDD
ncbi:MAG: hypothetical protein H6740_14145 [Alphaproteobacteria bacterium]|nr:hypothetical protein [Alphaproteobacteria bacterium]